MTTVFGALNQNLASLSKKGTCNYMALEVYKGQVYGASVDFCSLGIVLCRILNNGRLPFIPANAVK
ncbi:MAG: hypothetical protein LBC41_03955 [Clostridiales bacterium]|jgi:serine/threonine protein kinase|nr:hypothetical protein [Clostridiales bacterium]